MKVYHTMQIYNPEDLPIIEEVLKSRQLQCPVLIEASKPVITIQFALDYDYHDYEIASYIKPHFLEYEFVGNIESTPTPVRLSYHYSQNYGDPDGWGRPITNPIQQKLYLVKKTTPVQRELNPEIRVLLGDKERLYYINLVRGQSADKSQKGWLLLKSFENLYGSNTSQVPFEPKLYETIDNAYSAGYSRVEQQVEKDYEVYLIEKKKEKRKRKKKD